MRETRILTLNTGAKLVITSLAADAWLLLTAKTRPFADALE